MELKMKKYVQTGICYCALIACNGWGAISQSGEEFSPFGQLPGHQQNPDVAIGAEGGFAVWQNSGVTSKGERVVIHKLNVLLEGEGKPTRLTADTKRTDEMFPRVTMMPTGGAVVAWESGRRGERDVYIRFVNASGQYLTDVERVNGFKRGSQTKPDVAVNDRGDVLVTWESEGQDGDGKGVYAQRYTRLGIRVGGEIAVNQNIKWNQSNPTVAALTDGRFVIAWMGEAEQGITSAGTPFMRGHVMGRIFDRQGNATGNAQGNAMGNEFRLDGGQSLSSRPRIAAQDGGGFVVAWTQRDEIVMLNLLDVYIRIFNKDGLPLGVGKRHNNYTKGVQKKITLASTGSEVLVAWDCGTQDGASFEVHGRLVSGGAEFQVNTKTIYQQRMVSASGDGNGRIIVLWVDVVKQKNTTLKAQRFVTKGGGVDLAAGLSVTKGGIGPIRKPLVQKIDAKAVTPGGKLEQQREGQQQQAIVKHESAVQEASQIARNAAAKSAEDALKNEAIRMSTRGSGTGTIKSPITTNPPVIQTRQSNAQLNSGAARLSMRPAAARALTAYGMHGNTSRGVVANSVVRPTVSSRAEPTVTSMAANATLSQSARIYSAPRQYASSGRGLAARAATSYPSSAASRASFFRVDPAARKQSVSVGRGSVARVATFNPSSAISRSRITSANRVGNNPATTITMANHQSAQKAMKEYARRRMASASSSRFSMRPVTSPTGRGNAVGQQSIRRPVSAGVQTASQRAQAMRNAAKDSANQANAIRSVPVPATLVQTGGRTNLRFNSQAGRRYVVQTSADRTTWRNSGRVQRGTGSPMSMRVDSASSQRYIRVVPTN